MGDLVPLLQAYLVEIGESPLDGDGVERVAQAVAAVRIRFFVAYAEARPVGIASLTCAWSTFGWGAPVGMLEDVYVAPAHRRQGVARLLAERVLAEASAEGCRSVVVGCSENDVPMYRALGFKTRLGAMLAAILPAVTA